MFADTNILIDLFRGKASSIEMLEKFRGGIKISIIVLMELIDGLKSKSDIAKLRKQLINTIGIEIIQINDEISETSYELFSTFRHSHGISINDAIIAATALNYDEPLATLNNKHFEFIANLKLLL